MGPVELLVLKFPGNQFKGEIAPELQRLVDNRIIRVVDILFAIKDETGKVAVLEIGEMEDAITGLFDPVVADLTDLLTPQDAQTLTANIEPNSSAAIMLFENTWASGFADAVANANGQVVLNERIPRAVIEELLADAETETVGAGA
jgi:Family of unknown function (DUF6325)